MEEKFLRFLVFLLGALFIEDLGVGQEVFAVLDFDSFLTFQATKSKSSLASERLKLS